MIPEGYTPGLQDSRTPSFTSKFQLMHWTTEPRGWQIITDVPEQSTCISMRNDYYARALHPLIVLNSPLHLQVTDPVCSAAPVETVKSWKLLPLTQTQFLLSDSKALQLYSPDCPSLTLFPHLSSQIVTRKAGLARGH